jgi:phage-related protein
MENEIKEDVLTAIFNRLSSIESKVDTMTEQLDNLTSITSGFTATTEDLLGEEYAEGIKDLLGGLSAAVSNDGPDLKTMVDSFKDLRGRLGTLSEKLAETTPPMYRDTEGDVSDK